MQDTAIVVNEFGAVGIDDAVFAQTLDADNVVLLANGCLCCAAGDDLASTIWALAMRPRPPRRIVVETSGLAEPAPLLRRLMADPRLKQSTRLDAIVATIDAVDGLKNLDEQPVALRQCAVADRRLITKVDLVDAAHIAALSERLFALNRGASVVAVSRGAIDASVLFGAALYDERRGRSDLDRWLNLRRPSRGRAASITRRRHPLQLRRGTRSVGRRVAPRGAPACGLGEAVSAPWRDHCALWR